MSRASDIPPPPALRPPPPLLEGARVLEWAWSGKAPFYTHPFGAAVIPIHALALCQTAEGKLYRYVCDENWQVLDERACANLAEGRALPCASFDVLTVTWREADGAR